ncbi:N-acetyltransferase [Aquimarina sp. BL5]|uniref:GNAT family N-acetyltransferase n=1 Tax=Aquimarina sp. BL5 TaxID=1714860 RepID=UPI000E5460CD|nr:GNAT family N-acetyltransferase [Aquimarina sp. BL5]AXT52402.1 N-acetyltransferase [Aquimarina sp. BL5]RKN10317.1 GNAT family N-acetyltransferase [Aquimarina sp. BL5]
MSIIISTEKSELDIDFIHQFLTNSYWAKGRTKEEVRTSIEHCLNFGVYLDEQQVGFARVLTDYTVFGYLMDVFIAENHRGKGYSKKLIKSIIEHPELQKVNRWMLATADAHGLYKQFGFDVLPNPKMIMSKGKINR